MAVEDLNGELIKHHPDFPNDSSVENVEIGAGKTAFGKKFFPNCYLTERMESPVSNLTHFTKLDDYNEEDANCHFIDHFSDLDGIVSNPKTFSHVICCNPYGYGFRSENSTVKILNAVGKILDIEGKLIILGNSSNPWADYKKARKNFSKVSSGLNFNFELSEIEELSEEHIYRIGHKFFMTNLNKITNPTFRYFLTRIS